MTLPAGGPDAPQQSMPLAQSAPIALGRHAFGVGRAANARIAAAQWGSGQGEVGLEQGRNLAPIGGSSFDVDASGAVSVLDEANRRLLRWRPGVTSPEHVPLAIRGTLADLAVGGDGTLYVLETAADAGHGPQLRSFDADGTAHDAVELARARTRPSASGRMGPSSCDSPPGSGCPRSSTDAPSA